MKNAFVDANGVLVAHGFMESNGNQRPVPVDDDFDLAPMKWQLVDGDWRPYQTLDVPQVPAQITMRQARLALLVVGKLADVDAAIEALPSPQKEAAAIEWDYSAVVERDSSIIKLLGPYLGLDAEALDALFMEAATL